MNGPVAFPDALSPAPAPAPHDLDVEQALLGALLHHPREGMSIVRVGVLPKHFHEPLHARIFEAMLTLDRDGRAPTIPLLATALSDMPPIGDLSIVGYLAKLARDAVSVIDLPDYCRSVRDLAVARDAVGIAERLTAAMQGEGRLDPFSGVSEAVGACDAILAERDRGQATSTDAGGVIDAAMTAIERSRERRGAPEISFGLRGLDDRTGGLRRGNLALVAARTGMGKTTLLGQILLRAARAGHGIAFFSLEMSAEEVGLRMAASLATEWHSADPVSYFDLRRGAASSAHLDRIRQAREQAAKLPILVDTRPGLTIHDIAARCRRFRQTLERRGASLDLVLVDYLGLVTPSGNYRGQKVNEIGEISWGLKTLARQTECAVIAAHQLNREVEKRDNRRPTKADLRDSGNLEQDADLIALLYRPAYYLEQEIKQLGKAADELERKVDLENRLRACRHQLDVIIDKQRMGATGLVELYADMATGIVSDLDGHHRQEGLRL